MKKTLTWVHNAWMEDVTFPFPISGKRVKYTKDGKEIYKIIFSDILK